MDAKLIQIPPSTVDEFCDLIKLRKEFAPFESRYQKLYGELKALLSKEPGDAALTATGERHCLNISACAMDRTPDVAKVRKRLGAALFLTVVKVTVTALKEFLLDAEIEPMLIVTQSGPRRYNPVPIAAKATSGA